MNDDRIALQDNGKHTASSYCATHPPSTTTSLPVT